MSACMTGESCPLQLYKSNRECNFPTTQGARQQKAMYLRQKRLKEWWLFRTLIILTGNLNIHRLYFLCYRTTGITSTFALPITPNWNPIKIPWCEKSPSLCHLWATDPWEQEKKGPFQAHYCMSYWRWLSGKNRFILLYCKSPVKPKLNLNK